MTAVDPANPPPSLGEPTVRRADKDDDYGHEVWSVVCTTCGYSWFGREWESCNRCIERLEGEHGRFDEYQAVVHDISPPPGQEPPEDYDDALRGLLVDWEEFWKQDHREAEWLAEPIIAAHRSTAIFAPGGTGKSLLSLYISASIATGRKLFGRPIQPRKVLYLDYEMTADDLAERLEQMGFGDDVDLGNLRYALLPSLPGLDEPEGGKAVVRLAELCEAELVVIDTFGRAVHGDENDADTVRSWYRWTGIHLKHAGRAFLRVDHAGKDVTKGQRGTSAKNDDVDVVWEMKAKEAGAFTLIAKKRRMGWVPLSVDIVMNEDGDMRFELLHGHTWPTGTAEVAKVLDGLGVDVEASQRIAAKAFRESGHKARSEAIRAAQKYRQERSSTMYFAGDRPVGPVLHRAVASVENATHEEAGWPPIDGPESTTPRGISTTDSAESAPQESGRASVGDGRGALRGAVESKSVKPLVDGSGRAPGRAGAHLVDVDGAQCASYKGAHAPNVSPKDLDDHDFIDPI